MEHLSFPADDRVRHLLHRVACRDQSHTIRLARSGFGACGRLSHGILVDEFRDVSDGRVPQPDNRRIHLDNIVFWRMEWTVRRETAASRSGLLHDKGAGPDLYRYVD